ncbi:phage head spike fiber domain-containing protein [Pseudomonas reidholzensis]|nr:hypothetical protein [Pseudomonas reidholzensis]
MESKNFADLITYSRSTVARYFNSAGLLVQAAVNEPRFEFNPATLAPLGLKMEPARTNSLTYSQDLSNAVWIKSRTTATLSGVAPDGTATAYVLAGTGEVGVSQLRRNAQTWVAGSPHAVSIFAKAGTTTVLSLFLPADAFGTLVIVNFDLTGAGSFVVTSGTVVAHIQQCAAGWYRCTLVATPTTAGGGAWVVVNVGTTTTNSMSLWGSQVEIGTWSSSYIPTTTAAATRGADAAFLASLSPWYSPTGGTLYSEVVALLGATTSFHASLGTTASAGPRVSNYRTSAGSTGSQVADDTSATVFNVAPGIGAPNQVLKQAVAFKADDFQCAFNGVVSAVDNSGALPTPARLTLGARGTVTDQLSGHIRKIRVYPYRFSAPDLQAITS